MYDHKAVEKKIREGIALYEATKDIIDDDFKIWYLKHIKSKGKQYWDPEQGCICDRCNTEIDKIGDLRVMFGRRTHPLCFELDVGEWVEKGAEKGYIDEEAKLYFERIIKVLGSR